MHIYIDESGIFSNPGGKVNVASCVAALIVPSTYKVKLFREFSSLSHSWPKADGEVKGKLLDETQIAATIRLLQKYDCLIEINVIDLGIHTDEELNEFQNGMCDQIAGWATKNQSEDAQRRILEVAAELRRPKNPIFVEGFLLMVLMPRLLQVPINYYARRIPKELKSCHLTIDGKGTHITEFERAWYAIIFPSIQEQTRKQPLLQIKGGDYSYLERFQVASAGRVPEAGDTTGLNLEELLAKHFKFEDSKKKVGLQLADIIANATQRALNGKLQENGWSGLGGLMVTQDDPAIRLIRLDPKAEKYEAKPINNPFFDVINKMLRTTKPLWLSPDQEAKLIK